MFEIKKRWDCIIKKFNTEQIPVHNIILINNIIILVS